MRSQIQVVVLQGVSGSGKSTHAQTLATTAVVAGKTVTIVSADDYFVNRDGVYRFDPAKLGKAHAMCFSKFLDALHREIDVIVADNTNTTAAEIAPYMLAADAEGLRALRGVEAKVVHVRCDDLALAAERNAHGVPLRSIEAQAARIAAFHAEGGNPLRWPVQTIG